MMHPVPLVQTDTKTSEARSKIDPTMSPAAIAAPIPAPGSHSNHSTAFDENDCTSQNNVVNLSLRHRRRADQISTCDSGRQGAHSPATLVQTEEARMSLYSTMFPAACCQFVAHTSINPPPHQVSVKSFAPTSTWERISIQ
ncbi:hypothetical protein GQ55_3G134200 [Panicum hallii var. hallii]|uniref:Uncharacterized protein n=1 Tax=Panicum hallii var. hallii TaxID=1504633 RepID=A0A2T7E924_9POAL|nr:hypothetical protein GQ55_3G134200 [Panicum hallii var. hallii]